MAVTNFC